MAGSRGAALVTGAARRIGRAVALRLAAAGFDVAIHYGGSRDEAEALAGEIDGLGRRAVALQADLAMAEAGAALVRRAAEALGPLTLLVNNASVFEQDRFGAVTAESWARHLDVNLRAPVLLAQAFAALAPDGASIVNILDQRVLRPDPRFFSYSVAKAGLWHATRTMAQALAPRVRVNGVGPGPTLASVHQDQAAFAAEAAGALLGRPVDPEEIAAAVLYLVDARSVTGQMIAVDAGQHLGWKTPDVVE